MHTAPRTHRRRATAALSVLASTAVLALPATAAHAAAPQQHTGTTARPASAAPSGTPPVAYVDVAAATVWTSPDSPRPVDAPALANPVRPDAWMHAMTPTQKTDLTSKGLTQTQVLYGHPVYVLQEKDGWDKIAVADQPSPKNELGYPGWVPKSQLTRNAGYGRQAAHRPFALVDHRPRARLYDDPKLHVKDLQVSINTRLPELARTKKAVLVATPDRGPKWISAADVTVHRHESDIPRPSGADLVAYAKKFLGEPYLWGGRSGFGIDCSGFTSTIYQAHGIDLPRDADAQALHGGGHKVGRDDLRAGDLMFYADDKGSGSIYHVAMYIGGGKMIEAYDSTTPVRVTGARFGDDYWGAVRYLK